MIFGACGRSFLLMTSVFNAGAQGRKAAEKNIDFPWR
jgi:hypothetical protein